MCLPCGLLGLTEEQTYSARGAIPQILMQPVLDCSENLLEKVPGWWRDIGMHRLLFRTDLAGAR